MKIVLLSVGKTSNDYVKAEFGSYVKRLSHYIDFESIEIPNIKNSKNLSKIELKRKEGGAIIRFMLRSARASVFRHLLSGSWSLAFCADS